MIPSVLYIPIKGVYFRQIKAGEKPEEYRLFNDHWKARLVERDYDHIQLVLGYPKGGPVEGETGLRRKWEGYKVKTITHPHFGPEPVIVFAIDVSESAA